MPKDRFGWSVTFVALLLFGLFWIESSRVGPETNGVSASAEFPLPGYAAPDFILESIDAETLQLAQQQGKPIVLNFWATWCGPCRAEMPALQRISAEYADTALVIGVNQGELADRISPFADEFSITYPLLVDSDNQVNRLYRVRSLPTTFFIDSDGVIRDQIIGTASEAVLASKLDGVTE